MCVGVGVSRYVVIEGFKADIYVFRAQVAEKPNQQRRDMCDLLQEMGS